MSDLSQARADLASVLAGVTIDVPGYGPVEVPTTSSAPEEATPPCIITGPADPYVDFENVAFGEKRIHLVAVAVTEGTNDTAATQIDDMVTACLLKLLAIGSGFDVDQVDRPGRTTLSGQARLGVVIRVSRVVSLGL